jgi:hypothetical protein
MKNLNAIIDTYSNPAQDGIDAAIKDARRVEFLKSVCDQFKAFVIDSYPEHGTEYDDHLEFLKDSMECFIDLKNDGME